jgi:hypothetical protein
VQAAGNGIFYGDLWLVRTNHFCHAGGLRRIGPWLGKEMVRTKEVRTLRVTIHPLDSCHAGGLRRSGPWLGKEMVRTKEVRTLRVTIHPLHSCHAGG